MTDESAAKRVDGGVLGEAGAGGRAARRSSGGILSKAGGGGKAARRSSGDILSKAGGGGKAARRSSGGILGKSGAGGEAARRFSGGILSKAGGGGNAARRSSGGFLSKAGAGGEAARRSNGGILDGRSHNCRSHNRVRGMNQVRVVHTWSVVAEIAEVVVGARECWDGVAGNWCGWDEPIQTDARGEGVDRSKITGLDKVDADGVGSGEAAGSGAVKVGGWLWESRKEIGIGGASPAFQGVGVGGEELQPALDASVVFADFNDTLKRLVVRVDVELGGPEVAAETFDGPNDPAGFEVKRGPGSFVVESGAADKDDETDGAVGLFLFESRAKTVDGGVAVEAKRSEVVGDGVPVRVNQDRGGSEFVRDLADDGFIFRDENELKRLV